MIRVNLIPGAKKARRGGGNGAASAFGGVGALAARLRSRVKDPYLAAAAVSFVIAALFIGGTHVRQSARTDAVAERQERATGDSTRFALLLRERASAVAQRDSVARQLQIIRSIDNERYIWAHVMDEVSRALPPYTWLTEVEQTSAPALAGPVAATPATTPADTAKKSAADSVAAAAIKMHLVGNTVDIQALTRFMKDLEASPFVQNVTLNKSTLITVEGREVTQFELDCEYQKPDPAALRTVAVSLQAR